MKPMIFSAYSVRAIQDGRKTQTRRVIKPQPDAEAEYKGIEVGDHTFETDNDMWHIRAPYQPGDILWVREPFCEIPYEHEHIPINGGHVTLPKYAYKADSEVDYTGLWKSSRYMPKKTARLFLLVKSVWPEKLQDITAEDVFSEGIYLEPPMSLTGGQQLPKDWDKLSDLRRKEYFQDWARMDYMAMCHFVELLFKEYEILWDSLNIKKGYSWKNNDYVWKIVFERTEKP